MGTSSRLRRGASRAAVRLELEPLEDRQLLSGGLDPTFAAAGKLTVPLPKGISSEWATAAVVQKDGKIVLAGQSANGTIELIRLNPDGTADTSFGQSGRVALPFNGATSEQIDSLAIEPTTGKILVGGTVTATRGGTTNTAFLVARLNSNGVLDTSFGSGGEMPIDVGAQAQVNGPTTDTVTATTVALQDDGKVLLSGTLYASSQFQTGNTESFLVARLTSTGTLDTSFNGTGLASVAVNAATSPAAGAAAALAVQSDGAIVVAGTSGPAANAADVNNFTVVRLTRAGVLDTSFGSAGQDTFGFGTNLDNEARAIAIQDDGKILVGGTTAADFTHVANTNLGVPPLLAALTGQTPDSTHVANTDFALARLNADGSFDTTFNGTGEQTIAFDLGGTKADTLNALAIQDDGKILAAGSAVNATFPNTTSGVGGSAHFALVRLNADGTVDGSFGAGGKTDFGYQFGGLEVDEADAMALQPDGQIVLAGRATLSTDATGSDYALAVARVLASDEADTVGYFDPKTATWFLRNTTGPGDASIVPFAYGGKDWIPVVGDWNGDGRKSVGVFDPATATWYLKNNDYSGAPDITPFVFGEPGWIPVVGDWTGSGKTTVGVVDPTTGTWYLRNSNTAGPADLVFQYGAPGWIPVTGDWNGDGKTTIGVVDPKTETWYLKNDNAAGQPDYAPFQFGEPGWKPVVGDWNGDGKTTVGAVNPNGRWFLRNSNDAGAPDFAAFTFGAGGIVPVAGDWAVPVLPLVAARGVGSTRGANAAVSVPDLNNIVTAALTRIGDAGADPALVARLNTVKVQFGTLFGSQLASYDAATNTIVLDTNAGGWGWFVDQTPLQDEEFQNGKTAEVGSAAIGRMDLLSAVVIEMAHVIGLDQAFPSMRAPKLDTGERTLGSVLNLLSSLSAVVVPVPQSSGDTSTTPSATTATTATTTASGLPTMTLSGVADFPTIQNTSASGGNNSPFPTTTVATPSGFPSTTLGSSTGFPNTGLGTSTGFPPTSLGTSTGFPPTTLGTSSGFPPTTLGTSTTSEMPFPVLTFGTQKASGTQG
jgi:uncharacterized delta-60 repeat protein